MNEHIPYVQPDPEPRAKRRVPRWVFFVVGALLVSGAGAGTFASFSASTSNSGTFATGTLVLSNQVDNQTACFSTNGGTTDLNENACDALFTTTVSKPGDLATADVTLKNEGSLDGSALQAYAEATCTDAANTVATYTGSGNLCSTLQLTIQEYSDAARTTVSNCRYGNTTVADTCDFSGTPPTVAGFYTAYPDTDTVLGMGAMTSGASRYFRISVQLPETADNTFQGRQSTFGINWRVIQ